MSTLILYHKNCIDGFMASFFARKKLPNAKLKAVSYGELIPDVDGMNVYILDFCYEPELLLEISQRARSIIVLDHHITAFNKCKELDFCHFDMNKCGASLSYDYFKDPMVDRTPLLLDLVEFRDLGLYFEDSNKLVRFQQRYGRLYDFEDDSILDALYAYVDSFQYDYEIFETLLNELETIDGINRAVSIGEGIRRYQAILMGRLLKGQATFKLPGGLEIKIVNSPCFQSELGNILAKDKKVGVIWYQGDRDCKFSLRSEKDGPDVSKIALRFGGGGHKSAAGFSCDSLDSFLDLMFKDQDLSK